MRQKRAKAYRKLMHLYCQFFGFRQPYQALIDSETCTMAIAHKADLLKQLGSVLQGEVKPMITQCCIHELYLQGKDRQAAVDLAKTFERRKCNHREPIPGDECLSDVVGDKNKHRYVVVTQSQPLRVKLRSVPATPIVHTNRSVMVLEPPSDATLRTKSLAEEQSLHASTSDLALVKANDPEGVPRKKKKGPKGPNPLSVKKKKPAVTDSKTKGLNAEKGKGRAAEQSHESQGSETLGKRKRQDDDGDSDGPSATEEHIDATALPQESAAKKRRKRKRKVKAALEERLAESGGAMETHT